MIRPVPAVLCVALWQDRVLLVKRGHEPAKGLWGFPGGKIESGETMAAAALRELAEETGLRASGAEVLTALDALDAGPRGLRHHHVLIAMLCRGVTGTPVAADDASDARWLALDALDTCDLPLLAEVGRIAHLAAGC